MKSPKIIASLYPAPFEVRNRHDLSSAIVTPDRIYAYEEDKISTVKSEMTAKFAERSLFWGCKEIGIRPDQIDHWVFAKPSTIQNADTLFHFFSETIKAYVGSRDQFEPWLAENVSYLDHQIIHAATGVFTSEYKDSAFLCLDGGGDYGDPRNFIFGEYINGSFNVLAENFGYRNLGAFHNFLCDSLGFRDNGKVTGLAAYGTVQPDLYKNFWEQLRISATGIEFNRIRLARSIPNLNKFKPNEYERYKVTDTVPSKTNLLQMDGEYLIQDIAATGEKVLQDAFLELLKHLRKMTSLERLVLSGGLFQNVALNRVAKESGLFKSVHVPMVPSDAGMAFGAAMVVAHQTGVRLRSNDADKLTPYLGPRPDKTDIQSLLTKFRLNFSEEAEMPKKIAQLITEGNVIGIFQGPAELGPRALGNRSILADPRTYQSKVRINQNLKRRDWFMPYAPAVLHERGSDWFYQYSYSPYMHFTFIVKEEQRARIPAAAHIDGSARVQSVKADINPFYYDIIQSFYQLTGVPIVLNTSFNRHGIATISTARQAIEHLLEGCLDYLVLGDSILISLKENRILHSVESPLEEENVLLAADGLDRIRVLFEHAPESLDGYLKNLSNFLGFSILRFGPKIVVQDQSFEMPSEYNALKEMALRLFQGNE